jgi:hypothetical protein
MLKVDMLNITGRILEGEKPADLPVMQPTIDACVMEANASRYHGKAPDNYATESSSLMNRITSSTLSSTSVKPFTS